MTTSGGAGTHSARNTQSEYGAGGVVPSNKENGIGLFLKGTGPDRKGDDRNARPGNQGRPPQATTSKPDSERRDAQFTSKPHAGWTSTQQLDVPLLRLPLLLPPPPLRPKRLESGLYLKESSTDWKG